MPELDISALISQAYASSVKAQEDALLKFFGSEENVRLFGSEYEIEEDVPRVETKTEGNNVVVTFHYNFRIRKKGHEH